MSGLKNIWPWLMSAALHAALAVGFARTDGFGMGRFRQPETEQVAGEAVDVEAVFVPLPRRYERVERPKVRPSERERRELREALTTPPPPPAEPRPNPAESQDVEPLPRSKHGPAVARPLPRDETPSRPPADVADAREPNREPGSSRPDFGGPPESESLPRASPTPAKTSEPNPSSPPTASKPGGGGRGAESVARIQPRYPVVSVRRHEEGTVVLSYDVLPDGRAARIAVERSSGHRRLDDAAVKAVREAKFRSAMEDGQPVRSRVRQAFRFVLKG